MPHHTAPVKDAILPHKQLCDLFVTELSGLYCSEKELMLWLASIHPFVQSGELKGMFGDYTSQLEKQVLRLEEIFGLILVRPSKSHCDTILSLISEMKRSIDRASKSGISRDTAFIMATQKVIHYKVAFYRNMELLASSLGMEEVTNLLHLSAEDEKDISLLFADIAERRMNRLVEAERY
jgi:ferritin-like metal-binding protein YciE